MDQEPLNAYEKVIYNDLNGIGSYNEKGRCYGLRVFVDRHSVEVNARSWFDHYAPSPESPMAAFLASDLASTDIAEFFHLSKRWDQSKVLRDEIELEFERYAHAPCNSQSRARYGFSAVVPIENGGLFYAASSWGFLWGRTYLCRFRGAFLNPELLERQLLRMS